MGFQSTVKNSILEILDLGIKLNFGIHLRGTDRNYYYINKLDFGLKLYFGILLPTTNKYSKIEFLLYHFSPKKRRESKVKPAQDHPSQWSSPKVSGGSIPFRAYLGDTAVWIARGGHRGFERINFDTIE